MYTIDGNYENLIEIKKSKFISYAYNVENTAEIDKILGMLNERHRDATHICYAFVLSCPNLEKACDNGEPDGTAGKPILDVIKKNNLSDVLIAVVRYFGGIKLGAGGLVRAYSSSAGDVVKQANIGTVKTMTEYNLSCDIKYAKQLLEFLRQNKIDIKKQSYAERFNVSVSMEDSEIFESFPFELIIDEVGKVKVFYDKNI